MYCMFFVCTYIYICIYLYVPNTFICICMYVKTCGECGVGIAVNVIHVGTFVPFALCSRGTSGPGCVCVQD